MLQRFQSLAQKFSSPEDLDLAVSAATGKFPPLCALFTGANASICMGCALVLMLRFWFIFSYRTGLVTVIKIKSHGRLGGSVNIFLHNGLCLVLLALGYKAGS